MSGSAVARMRAAGRPSGSLVLPAGTGPTVHSLVPRALLLAGAVLGVVAQTAGRDVAPGALLPVLLALVAAWRPALPAALLAVLGLMVLAVLGGGGPDVRDALTVLAVHVVHVAAALSAVLPHGCRVEVAGLRPTWRRFVGVQALSQAVVAVAVAASLAG